MELKIEDITTTTESRIVAIPVANSEQKDDWFFVVDKTWTYGDITTNIFLILILAVLVWSVLRDIFKTKFYSK